MKQLMALLVVAMLLTGCDDDKNGFYQSTMSNDLRVHRDLTYQELANYPKNCVDEDAQLAQLTSLQARKNFVLDPDELSEDDRKYNSLLKSTIWWYSYSCDPE